MYVVQAEFLTFLWFAELEVVDSKYRLSKSLRDFKYIWHVAINPARILTLQT